MMINLKRYWNSVLRIGYQPWMNETQEMRLFTLNAFIAISSVLTILFVVVFTSLGSLMALQGLIVLPALFIVMYFNYKGKYAIAQFLVIYLLLFLVLALALADRRTGTEYILIALGCSAAMLFERLSTIVISFLAAFGCYVFYTWYDATRPFTPDPNTPYLLIENSLMFLSGLAVAVQSLVYRNLIKRYSHSLKIANDEIGAKNEELKASNEKLTTFSENLDSMVKQKSTELQAYIDAINVNIYSSISDLDGIFLEVNEQVVATSGYSRNELIGSHFSKLSTDRYTKEYFLERRSILMEGKSWRGEVEHAAKDGQRHWFDIVVIPLRDNYGTINSFLTLGMPITERKKNEQMKNETSQLLETIAFRASHKIRGPLATIDGLTMLLQKKLVSQEEFEQVARWLAASNQDLKDATTELVKFVNEHPINKL